MIRKIIIWLTLIGFILDKYIDKENTNYNAWIILFLFWIAWNTMAKHLGKSKCSLVYNGQGYAYVPNKPYA